MPAEDYVPSLPFVTVVVPIRNEAAHISDNLKALIGQTYPHEKLEIIVVDGMSNDSTRPIVTEFQTRYPNVRLIDNPAQIVSAALNIGISRASGEIIIRVDGHAVVAPDFVEQNVRLLGEHPEVDSTGGPIQHKASTPFGNAAVVAMSQPIGIGDACQRYPDFEGYVDGAQFPAFRRSVFERVGLFDETLVRNQDDEFIYRLRQAKVRTYISPRVRYSYYVREYPTQLFRQYFQYGYWRIPVMLKHRRPTTLRQLIPLSFYALVCTAIGVGLLAPSWWWSGLVLPLLYSGVLLVVGLGAVPLSGWTVAVRVPFAIAIIHAAYAAGMAFGWWSHWVHPESFHPQGRMSALSR